MTAERRAVLVTGSHRSGSTWVGRLLAAADELHYVQEPFNIVARQRWLSPRPPHQFLHVTADDDARWRAPMQRVLDLRYPLAAHLRTRPDASTAKRMVRVTLDARQARRRGAAALVKDPIALFSTPWLRRTFDLDALVLVRDPVAFVGSLVAREWDFDFRHWTRQPGLLDEVLPDFADEIRARADEPGSLIDHGILLWNCCYVAVDRFRADDPGLIVHHYEKIAAEPHVEIEGLYERLGLRFGPRQREIVDQLSTGGGATGAEGSSAIDVRRDSRAALATWRERLDDATVERIRRETADVADRFR